MSNLRAIISELRARLQVHTRSLPPSLPPSLPSSLPVPLPSFLPSSLDLAGRAGRAGSGRAGQYWPGRKGPGMGPAASIAESAPTRAMQVKDRARSII